MVVRGAYLNFRTPSPSAKGVTGGRRKGCSYTETNGDLRAVAGARHKTKAPCRSLLCVRDPCSTLFWGFAPDDKAVGERCPRANCVRRRRTWLRQCPLGSPAGWRLSDNLPVFADGPIGSPSKPEGCLSPRQCHSCVFLSKALSWDILDMGTSSNRTEICLNWASHSDQGLTPCSCPLRFRLEPVIVFRPCTDIHIAAELDSFHVCELQVGGIKRTSIIAPALLRSSGGRCVNDVQI